MDESELDKSEQATPFRLRKSRERGAVARGMDLGMFSTLIAAVGFAWLIGPEMAVSVARAGAAAIAAVPGAAEGGTALFAVAGALFSPAVGYLMILGGGVFAVVLAGELLQVGPIFSVTPLKPDFGRINPAKGLKRLFSWRMLIEAFKSLLKLSAYGVIAWLVIAKALRADILSATDGVRLLAVMGGVTFRLVLWCTLAAFFFAVIDQILARREFGRGMRMSRRQLRREHRENEGDPRIRQKRRKRHAEFSRVSQSLRNVKGADIIIANPDHIAIALRYDKARMSAPHVVTRGSGHVAERIKRLAFLHGVVIVRDPPLARALFVSGQLEREIPEPHYQAVADLYLHHNLANKEPA